MCMCVCMCAAVVFYISRWSIAHLLEVPSLVVIFTIIVLETVGKSLSRFLVFDLRQTNGFQSVVRGPLNSHFQWIQGTYQEPILLSAQITGILYVSLNGRHWDTYGKKEVCGQCFSPFRGCKHVKV